MPTRELAIWDHSFQSSADLIAKQYFSVVIHSVADQIALSGAGVGVGILQNKPNSNLAAQVRLHGISRHVVDGNATAIVINDPITSDANGKGVKADTAGDVAYGYALEASTADNDVISILMTGPFRIHS